MSMILFREDWAKFPSAIMDTSTKNKSFLNLALLWRDMGVKNHAFPLALINPALQGVDPFSKDLTIEQMGMISLEARTNPWYYFREIAKAPARSGNMSMPFLANRGNIALFWSYFNHLFTTLIQPRQTGKSFSLDTLTAYLLNLRLRNSTVNLLTKDDTLRRANVRRLKDIIELLPPYLNQMGKNGSKNSENITCESLGNMFNTFLPQSSIARANNVGRGMTTETMLFDEGPFQPNFKIAFPAAVASAAAAQDIAKARGEPYGIINTTTAGKINEESGAFVFYELIQTAAYWDDPFFLDADNEEDLRKRVIATCRNSPAFAKDEDKGKDNKIIIPRINATFSHRQLGYTDDWLREKIAQAAGDKEASERDYLNMWTNGTASSPFSVETTKRIMGSELDPLFKDYDRVKNFITNWYIPKEQLSLIFDKRDILMGLDSSDAVGSDTMAVTFMDAQSAKVIGSATLNNMSIFTFSQWLAETLIRFPKVLLVPENRSSGQSIIDFVSEILGSKGIDPFRRIFNRIVQEKENFPDLYDELRKPFYSRSPDFYSSNKGLMGYKTGGHGEYSRDRLYGTVLSTMTQRFAEHIADKTLIQQMMGLTTKDGRIDHKAGGHDDQVISYLLPGWLLLFGKNVTHYGLNPLLFLTQEPRSGMEAPKSKSELFNDYEQKMIQKKIHALLEDLKHEKEDIVVQQMERELRFLDKKVVSENKTIDSINSLIEQAREERLKTHKLNHYHNRNSSDVYTDLLKSYITA